MELKAQSEMIEKHFNISGDISSVNAVILFALNEEEKGKVSDGHHTFDELYHHRTLLFIMWVRNLMLEWSDEQIGGCPVWWTRRYSSGNYVEDGWFILGVGTDKGTQITYHIKDKYLELIEGKVPQIVIAPEFDGHNSKEVANRLEQILKNN